MLGATPSPGVGRRIHELTGGHPFYINATALRLAGLVAAPQAMTAQDAERAFVLEALSRNGQIYNYCRYLYDISLSRARGYGILKAILQTLAEEEGLALSELARRIFADHRLRVVGLPTDEYGLVIEALEDELKRQRPVLLYTIPTHQNPSGATLPLDRRQRLVELSQEHGFRVLADEVYHCLSYGDASPPPPLASFVDSGSVLSLGSFSKILAPGLRLGWVQGRADRLQTLAQCGLLDSGGGLNPFTAAVVRSALDLGLQEQHLDRLRQVYAARLDALDAALQRYLAGHLNYRRPAGGFFIWARLADGRDAEGVMEHAQAQGVSFRPGMRFSSRDGLRNAMRLCFAYYDEARLAEGVIRLAEVVATQGR